MIISDKNDKIKYLKKLKSSKYIKISPDFLCEGFTMLEEAIKSNAEILDIYLDTNYVDEFKKAYDLPYIEVSSEVIRSITDTVTGKECVFLVKKDKGISLDDSLVKKLLYLDGLNDPGNMGTIIRSLEAFGWDGILLGKNTVNPYNEKVVRSSMGSIFRVKMKTSSIEELIALKNEGFKVIISDLNGENKVKSANKKVLVIGNEARGVSRDISEISDEIFTIPMKGMVESLNAGVAASLAMYLLKED